MSSQATRIAVVGVGYWGVNLLRVSHELGVLAGICDEDPESLKRANQQYPDVSTFSCFDDVLASDARIDAIVLAVPAPLHVDFALRALRAGKDVFVEKPLALDICGAERVAEEAVLTGQKVFVGHLLLFHPGVCALLELVHAGAIGDVVHVRSRRLSWGKVRERENVWWSFATHDVAVLLAVLQNAEPIDLTALQTAHVRAGIADFAYADYRFRGGQTAHIEVSWLDPDKSARIDVFGTYGVLTFTDSRGGAKLLRTPTFVENADAGTAMRHDEAIDIPFETGEPLRLELQAFLAWIQGGVKPRSDVRNGLDVVRVLALTQAVADDSQARSVGTAGDSADERELKSFRYDYAG